jgi:hypothetical protein
MDREHHWLTAAEGALNPRFEVHRIGEPAAVGAAKGG